MRSESLDYRVIPGQNPLFLKYLYEFAEVEQFYAPPVHLDPELLKRRARRVLEERSGPPAQVLMALTRDFNRAVGSGERTFKNIEKLGSGEAVAVVTGQQLGFLGGPSYTIYKAITAISLAARLEEMGVPAVPVFWLASDDSDFEEVRSATFLGPEGHLFTAQAGPARENNSTMVGALSLEGMADTLSGLGEMRGEFKHEVLGWLRDAYADGSTFRHAFGRWLARIFQDQGLLLFDALSPYKPMATGVFSTLIEKREEILSALRRRSSELTRHGFTPQVRVAESESLLFEIEGKERHKWDFSGGSYRLRGSASRQARGEDLLGRIRSDASRFAPNVLLRPIVQDTLFPTATYVGGAAEIAYYAQVHAISSFWNLEVSVFPRAGVTLVDRKAQRLLERYHLKVEDILQGDPEAVAARILAAEGEGNVLDGLLRLQAQLQQQLKGLRKQIEPLDPSVSQMLSRAESKILYQLDKVNKRFVANRSDRRSALGRHLEYLYQQLFPRNRLQERVINFNQFFSQEGPGLVNRLVEKIDPFAGHHQLFHL